MTKDDCRRVFLEVLVGTRPCMTFSGATWQSSSFSLFLCSLGLLLLTTSRVFSIFIAILSTGITTRTQERSGVGLQTFFHLPEWLGEMDPWKHQLFQCVKLTPKSLRNLAPSHSDCFLMDLPPQFQGEHLQLRSQLWTTAQHFHFSHPRT